MRRRRQGFFQEELRMAWKRRDLAAAGVGFWAVDVGVSRKDYRAMTAALPSPAGRVDQARSGGAVVEARRDMKYLERSYLTVKNALVQKVQPRRSFGRCCDAEPGSWSDLQQHLAEHLCDVFKNGFGDASMEQAQVRGGDIARAGPTGSATGGGRGRQRMRSAPAIGRGAGHSVASQRGRTERVDRHRLQNLSCPLRGASGRGNGRGRAVLSRSSGRHQGQTRGRTRRGSRTARSPVRARVGGVSAKGLAATKGLAPEHVATVKTYWEGNVVKSSPAQLARRAALPKPCRKIDGKEFGTIVFCLDPVTFPEARPGLEARSRTSRERSIEATSTDAGEVERLARKLEAVSQRMADILRREECWIRRWHTLSS